MGFVEELLGCSLVQIVRSFWAVKLDNDDWLCEANMHHDYFRGVERFFDWSLDLVATGDVLKVKELWLLCPPSRTSPLGNTARLVITEPGTAFQLKIATVDSNLTDTSRAVQAHVIGKVTNKETGACECFIWDDYEQALLAPETRIYDAASWDGVKRDKDGLAVTAGRNNVYNFHSWRTGIAPLGRLAPEALGLRL